MDRVNKGESSMTFCTIISCTSSKNKYARCAVIILLHWQCNIAKGKMWSLCIFHGEHVNSAKQSMNMILYNKYRRWQIIFVLIQQYRLVSRRWKCVYSKPFLCLFIVRISYLCIYISRAVHLHKTDSKNIKSYLNLASPTMTFKS